MSLALAVHLFPGSPQLQPLYSIVTAICHSFPCQECPIPATDSPSKQLETAGSPCAAHIPFSGMTKSGQAEGTVPTACHSLPGPIPSPPFPSTPKGISRTPTSAHLGEKPILFLQHVDDLL